MVKVSHSLEHTRLHITIDSTWPLYQLNPIKGSLTILGAVYGSNDVTKKATDLLAPDKRSLSVVANNDTWGLPNASNATLAIVYTYDQINFKTVSCLQGDTIRIKS